MKTHARVIVIGGGIGGCSALYHLTKEGWSDVVLVERDELTSGTTWHSAAQCPNLAFNQLLILLRSYSISLYKELSEDPEYPIDYHHAVGGLRLITDQDNLDACRHIISVERGVGVDFELVGADEAASRNPLLTTDDLLAALWDPLDGDIDPAQLCQALARRSRKVGLCYFLTGRGNILAEATIARLDEGRFWYGSAAAAEYHDMDWLREHMPQDSDIMIESLTNNTTTLVIAGPKSRQLMQRISPRSDWSRNGFPGMSVQRCCIGHIEAIAMSVSFSAELAYELHISNSQLLSAYKFLIEAGQAFDLSHFGMHAIDSMRIEKGYGHWKADLITEFNPFEAGLERFIDMRKSFPGKAGLEHQLQLGYRRKRELAKILRCVTSTLSTLPAAPGLVYYFWARKSAQLSPDIQSQDYIRAMGVLIRRYPVKSGHSGSTCTGMTSNWRRRYETLHETGYEYSR